MSNANNDNHPQQGPGVTITVNGTMVRIHRGRQTVVDIKRLGTVDPAEELEQSVDGVFTPLADDGSVTLKGGEVFVSHVRAGAAA